MEAISFSSNPLSKCELQYNFLPLQIARLKKQKWFFINFLIIFRLIFMNVLSIREK